jgi:hypothetical protein
MSSQGAILARVDKLSDAVEKISKDAVRWQVYAKVLWPALSVSLTIIGILIGRFVL